MAELDYDYIAKLVRKTQAGDSDAFAELYAATYKKQYYFTYQYVKDSYCAGHFTGCLYFGIKKYTHIEKSKIIYLLAESD